MKLMIVWHAGTVPQYRDRYLALEDHFDEITVVVPRGWREVEEHPLPSEIGEKTRVYIAECWLPYHPYSIVYRRFGAIVRECNPDLIYAHEEPVALSSFQTSLYAQRAGIPCVIDSALGHTEWDFWGGNPFEQYVYRTTELVYYRNEQCRVALQKRGCPREKLRGPLPNGVSSRTFSPVSSEKAAEFLCNASNGRVPPRNGVRDDVMRVGFAGRVCYEKGVDLLINLPKLIDNINIIICGPILDKNYENVLQESSGVYYIGEVDGSNMNKFYSACDLTVLPSLRTPRWEEQFGRVLTESIACETPAIGSNVGMIDEIVGEDATFPENDSSALADLVNSLRDPTTRSSLLEWQQQRLRERYTWSVIAETVRRDAQALVDPS